MSGSTTFSGTAALVVLHFKQSSMTNSTLQSALQAMSDRCVMVVVDASHDFSPIPEIAARIHELVRPEEYNPGFSRAMNLGFEAAQRHSPDIVVFSNNDVEFPTGSLDGLLALADESHERVAAFGPKIVFYDDPSKVWSAGGHISRLRCKAVQDYYLAPADSLSGIANTKFLSGCVIAVRPHAFEDVGRWNPMYFFGGEEWDLSLKLRREGYELLVDMNTTVHHKASVEAGHGSSHSFEDLRFLLNSYLNRMVFSYANFGVLFGFTARLRLALYCALVLPNRSSALGSEAELSARYRIGMGLASRILSRDSRTRISFEELEDFSRTMNRDLQNAS